MLQLVAEAHTKAEHVTRWWGPRGFTLPVCEMAFRPGGAWRFMRLGLMDEYRIFVNPVVLGGGTPLFKDVKNRAALKLLKTQR